MTRGKMSRNAIVEANNFATPEDCHCNRSGIFHSDLDALCGFVVNPPSYDVFIHHAWDRGASQRSTVTNNELSAALQQVISQKYQHKFEFSGRLSDAPPDEKTTLWLALGWRAWQRRV